MHQNQVGTERASNCVCVCVCLCVCVCVCVCVFVYINLITFVIILVQAYQHTPTEKFKHYSLHTTQNEGNN